MHGPRPQLRMAATRAEEFALLAERIRSWLALGIEPHAIGVAARSASLVREAREALKADGIMTASLSGRGNTQAVRAGTMHAMKGLEFQAVAVIGVEQGLVPEPAAITPESEDAVAHAQDLQRERCVLFVACTRARDHLYVSGTGEPSVFLPPRESDPPPSGRDGAAPAARAAGAASPPKVSMRELLWLREDSWRPRLRGASLVAEADLRPDHTRQVADVLGRLYAELRDPRSEGERSCRAGRPAWPPPWQEWRRRITRAKRTGASCGRLPASRARQRTRRIWGRAFNTAVGRLGMATFPELPLHSAGAISDARRRPHLLPGRLLPAADFPPSA